MSEESTLIRAAKTRANQDAFSNLVKRYQGMVRAFLFRLCSDWSLADDLAQDTFMQAYRKLSTFRGDSSFQTWLLAIAYRCFLQTARREKNERLKQERFHADYEITPEYCESISAEQLDLERTIILLKPQEIAVISLCSTFGCSHSEAAEILKIPLGTIKTHMTRGKTRLKELLRENTNTDKHR